MLKRHLIGSNGAFLNKHWQFKGFTRSGLKLYIKKNDLGSELAVVGQGFFSIEESDKKTIG